MHRILYFLAFAVYCVNGIVQPQNVTNRMINGNLATETQFPYAISLQQIITTTPVPETRGHRCGGILITLQHALTAASCLLTGDTNGTIITAANFRVFAGSALLTNDAQAQRIRTIANFTVHPEFIAGPSFLNDIAIITFTTPFTADTVTPLPLPAATFDPADFTVCTVAGWGAASVGTVTVPVTASTQLRFANKYVYSQSLCMFLYSTLATAPNVMPGMMCAASFDVLTAGCTGDSGNALVCNNTLTGILFSYTGCEYTTSYPELYTRVSNYTTWIRSITGAGYSFTPTVFLFVLAGIVQIIVSNVTG